MTVSLSSNSAAVTASALDIATAAMLEATILDPGEVLAAAEGKWVLEKLQRLIDQFNARRELIYNVSFSRFALKTNHSPHTIGPRGDFDMPQRPVKIVSWALILKSATPEVELVHPVVQDNQWWASQTVKNLTSTLPTELFYSPDNPLGSCYFWPIPTQANDVRLETWANLTQAVTLQTKLSLPQGYWDAIVNTLAVQLCPSFSKEPSPTLVRMQREAMGAITANNGPSPRIETSAGMAGNNQRRPGFNFLTGKPW